MMKILGIVGSPRKGGNTDVLVDRVLEGARNKGAEVEKIYLHDLEILPCQGAFSCEARKRCVLPDDMQGLYGKLQQASGMVIGTPIYVGNVSGPLLNFLDRCRPFLSFLDAVGIPPLPSSEEKALSQERSCLQIWKGEPYSELPCPAEEIMAKAIKSYTDRHDGAHPVSARRLPKGKKGAILLTYHQRGEEKYQGIIDFLLFNMRDLWGLEIVDVIPAYRVLKKGDSQKRGDLWERAYKAGQLL